MGTLRARLLTEFDILLTGDGDLGAPDVAIAQAFRQAFDTGTTANQAQVAFGDTRPIGSSSTDNLDLAGGLAGLLGGTLTFTAIKDIFIYADPANTGNIRVGKGISNAFVGPFGASAIGNLVEPGGWLHLMTPSAAGWAVTVATGDILSMENLVAAGVNYTIILIGEGAAA